MNYVNDNRLTEDAVFVMKESKVVNLVVACVCFILFFIILYHVVTDYHADQLFIYYKLALLSFIPAIIYLWQGWRSTELLAVSKQGIYRCGALLCNWEHFIRAYIEQDKITGSYADNFVLYVIFCTAESGDCYSRKMKLPNTRDKSEEEIIAAINYFFMLYQKNISLQEEDN